MLHIHNMVYFTGAGVRVVEFGARLVSDYPHFHASRKTLWCILQGASVIKMAAFDTRLMPIILTFMPHINIVVYFIGG